MTARSGQSIDELGAGTHAERRGGDDRLDALKQATIMMVDDESIIIETLENLLEDAGYKHFISTTNPKEAVELMQSKKPDIVLLDVMMPEVTGLDILESMEMDEELQYTPSIIITAATDTETKLKALDLGATDVLNKPVDPSELALRVRNTLATKANQDRLMKFDDLTGLPNRRYFMIALAKALAKSLAKSSAKAEEESKGFALLHIDLDNFKEINDTLGNGTGDALLKGVAKRLESWVRDSNIASISGVDEDDIALSRIGGDEFVLILHNMVRVADATKLSDEIATALKEPYRVGGREIFLTASIGVALSKTEQDESAAPSSEGALMDALLSRADAAMAEAKRRGRNRVQAYTNEINAEARERQSFEATLREALTKQELSLTFSPKASVWTNQITGAEAHLRWRNPELGDVPSERFVPIAEETGLMVPISEWMLYEACSLASSWQSASISPVRITVCISSRQFDLSRLALAVRSALNSADVSGECLGLQFTESIFVDNPEENRIALKSIRDLGVELSIGRFGTGHSSLGLLRGFPLNQLVVDRSFVEGVPGDTDNAAILASFIPMTHSLGLTVVADGVDRDEQLEFLKDRGCDEYQGNLLGKAVEPGDFLSRVMNESD